MFGEYFRGFNYKLICLNTGIEWEELDYHLNIESMLHSSIEKVA